MPIRQPEAILELTAVEILVRAGNEDTVTPAATGQDRELVSEGLQRIEMRTNRLGKVN